MAAAAPAAALPAAAAAASALVPPEGAPTEPVRAALPVRVLLLAPVPVPVGPVATEEVWSDDAAPATPEEVSPPELEPVVVPGGGRGWRPERVHHVNRRKWGLENGASKMAF